MGTAGGAGEHWWSQRLTAVALVPLGLWLAISLALLPDFAFATVIQWAQRPVTSILLILTVLTIGYHSYLGMQVIIEDYVHAKALKVLAIIRSAFGHAALAIAALFAILKVAFGTVA